MKLYAVLFGVIVEIDAARARPVADRLIEAHGRLLAFDENLFFSRVDAERKLRPPRSRAGQPGPQVVPLD